MPPRIASLFRYPVKGFTPERRDSLTVLPPSGSVSQGRVRSDRAFAFQFADAPLPDERGWMPKTNYVALSHTPGAARASLSLDDAAGVMRIGFPDGSRAEAGLDDAGRAALSKAVAAYCLSLSDSPLTGHPEKLPIRLIGDPAHTHFHDNPAGRVSLHSRASVRAIGEAVHDPDFDDIRFRSNVVIEGAHEWEEFSWVGKRVRIGPPGGPVFEVAKTNVRCLATHANPLTGERDCDVMNTLTRTFGHDKPQFAVSMDVIEPGEIYTGDPVTVLG